MTSITGVTFAEAWRGRVKVKLAGIEVGFLGRTEFLRNKALAARPKDLLDIALLEEVTPPRRRSTKRR